jgi:hypothetical protein
VAAKRNERVSLSTQTHHVHRGPEWTHRQVILQVPAPVVCREAEAVGIRGLEDSRSSFVLQQWICRLFDEYCWHVPPKARALRLQTIWLLIARLWRGPCSSRLASWAERAARSSESSSGSEMAESELFEQFEPIQEEAMPEDDRVLVSVEESGSVQAEAVKVETLGQRRLRLRKLVDSCSASRILLWLRQLRPKSRMTFGNQTTVLIHTSTTSTSRTGASLARSSVSSSLWRPRSTTALTDDHPLSGSVNPSSSAAPLTRVSDRWMIKELNSFQAALMRLGPPVVLVAGPRQPAAPKWPVSVVTGQPLFRPRHRGLPRRYVDLENTKLEGDGLVATDESPEQSTDPVVEMDWDWFEMRQKGAIGKSSAQMGRLYDFLMTMLHSSTAEASSTDAQDLDMDGAAIMFGAMSKKTRVVFLRRQHMLRQLRT